MQYCTIRKSMEAILFDFGGTLDSNGIHWRDRFYRIYSDFGVSVSREAFANAYYDADDNLHIRHRLEGADLEKTLTCQISDVLKALGTGACSAGPGDGGHDGRRDRLEKIRNRFISDSRKFLAVNRILLKKLKKRFKLAIVSNFYGNLESVLEGENLLDMFEFVADSGREGVVKPSPRIFQRALDAVSVRPSQALMVGDSIERDMRGAESLDMPHAWLCGDRVIQTGAANQSVPQGQSVVGHSPCCGQCIILKNLGELPEKLKTLGHAAFGGSPKASLEAKSTPSEGHPPRQPSQWGST